MVLLSKKFIDGGGDKRGEMAKQKPFNAIGVSKYTLSMIIWFD